MRKQKIAINMALCFILTNALVMPVHAAENVDVSINAKTVGQATVNNMEVVHETTSLINDAKPENETGKVVYYDMAQGGTQVFEIVDENGDVSTITVTEITSYARVADGAYKIEHEKAGLWKANYTIKVSNNKIVSAYNPYSEAILGQITSSNLMLESDKQATYYLHYALIGVQYSTGVRSNISNGEIKISVV